MHCYKRHAAGPTQAEAEKMHCFALELFCSQYEIGSKNLHLSSFRNIEERAILT